MIARALGAVLLVSCWPQAASLVAQARTVASLEVAGAFDHRLVDTNGDGAVELVLLHADRLRRFSLVDVAWRPDGELVVEQPAHTLVTFADVLPTAGEELVAADPRRIATLPWGDGEPVVLARRARFRLRVDRPRFAPFVVDLNLDGRLDLMLPSLRGVTPYFRARDREDGRPSFTRLDEVPVRVAVQIDPGSRGLDQELVGSVRIPQIQTEDLNADGRPDMLTREGSLRAFRMQAADGSFAQPIEVDITQFVDSTPRASVEFGSTAVLGDSQQIRRADVNGDGLADHVIAHRRKLWTFLGTAEGPQFRRARTQAVADDVTALLLADLDEDGGADLLTFRVQVPGVASLVLGLVRSIDVEIRAVGYPSEADGFAKKPAWRRTLTLRVPPLLSLLGRQEELIERFTEAISQSRPSARGAFLEAGRDDLAIVTPDGASAALYTSPPPAPKLSTQAGVRLLRRLLFEDEDAVFDVERVFGLLSGFVSLASEQGLDAQQAVATVALRDPGAWRLLSLERAQLDDEPMDELIATYTSTADPAVRAFDALRWR